MYLTYFRFSVDFEFEEDSYRFIGFLTALAGIGFAYTCYRLVRCYVFTKFSPHSRFHCHLQISIGEKTVGDIFLDAADLITIVIPPALPAAITIGSIYAQKRLKEKGIFCISPRTINVAGSINCVCFDKTGTLTEDGLDMHGVVPSDVEKSGFQPMIENHEAIGVKDNLIKAMATCHSLTNIEEKLSGDPIGT